MATLMHANKEWRKRPADERFYDVTDVIPILERQERMERSVLVPMDEITVTTDDDDLFLNFPKVPTPVRLNHWSLSRLCDQIGMSAADVRKYPAEIYAPLIQYRLRNAAGIAKTVEDSDDNVDADVSALYGELATAQVDSQANQLNVLMAPNHTGLVARSVDSAQYGRYKNLSLARDAMIAVEQGWRTPRCMPIGNDPRNRIATVDDEMRCSLIKAGQQIGPGGVYYGDRNFFIFLASDKEVLPGHFRFVTLENSEVGENRKLRATFGLMNYVCMNHILWGVSNVHMVEKKHRRGSVSLFREEFAEALNLVSRASGVPDGLYALAKSTELGKDRDEIVDKVYKRRLPGLTQKAIGAAFDCAVEHPQFSDGASPTSVWGLSQGLTWYSQTFPNADKRHDIDKAAGALLDELRLEDGPVTVAPGAEFEADGSVVVETLGSKPKSKSKSKTKSV